MNEQDEELKKRIEQIFPSPQVASAVVNLAVGNKPIGWGKHSNAPYFKRVYGEQVKSDIDKHIANGGELVYRYTLWCTGHKAMSKQTLYNRINQSIRYILEKMDSSGKYKEWYEKVHISREPGVGVVIRYIQGLSNVESFKAEECVPREDKPLWMRRLDEWLESPSKEPFIQEKLALSQTEITDLQRELALLVNIVPYITASSVKIIKM